MMKITNTNRRLAVVTGASNGMGAEIARDLSDDSDVLLVARNQEALHQNVEQIRANGGNADYLVTDLSDEHEVEAMRKEIMSLDRSVDILVNVAGSAPPERLLSTMPFKKSVSGFRQQISANLETIVFACLALAHLMTRPGGRIVNFTSMAAQTGGARKGSAGYASAKAGVHGYTLGLARELGPHGVTVNSISPGFVADTGFTESWGPAITKPLIAATPVGRAGTTADFAAAVRYLTSADAGFVHAQHICINGGIHTTH